MRPVLIILTFLTWMGGFEWIAFAQPRWQPFKLSPKVSFLDLQYQIKTREGQNVLYGIQVQRMQNQKVKVKIQSEAEMNEDKIGAQTLLGFWGLYGISYLAFFNPAFAMFYSQMDLQVGEKMSFFGAGYAKVTGEKVVGGRKGKVVEFYQRDGDKDHLATRTVIDPLIFIPIENIIYDDKGNIETQISLIKATVR